MSMEVGRVVAGRASMMDAFLVSVVAGVVILIRVLVVV